MTLNILFLTITIKRKSINLEEIERNEMVKKIYEENKNRHLSMHRMF